MDQGLFAVSNFALNILLARWLTSTDYGAFSVAYTVFLLLGTFHTALLTEPMLVFGPGKYASRFPAYLGVLLRGHWGFTALAALLFTLAGLAFAFAGSGLAPVLFALALASPFILFQWIMRRACYVNLQPRLAAYAGGLYMALVLAGAWLLYAQSWLGAAQALGVMALASLLSGGWLVYRLQGSGQEEARQALAREALEDHWTYGAWIVGAAVLTWIPGNAFYIVLPLSAGLEAGGALRAMSNFLMPILHINTALAAVLLPSLAAIRARSAFLRRVSAFGTLMLASAGTYWLILVLYGARLENVVYGGSYSSYLHLLWILSFSLFFSTVVTVTGAAVRAVGRPKHVFQAYLAALVVTLTLGLYLVFTHGATGAAISLLVSPAVVALVLMFLLAKSLREVWA
jgi:O-antigen/teichoic acid export membrane protein